MWRLMLASGLLQGICRAADMTVAGHPPAAVIERTYELLNDARSKSRDCGGEHFAPSPPLAVSGALQEAARVHAEDMARRRYFEHRGRDGSEPRDRVARQGYAANLSGENIAYGPESAEEVVAGWLASPGHCANIMDPRFRDTGLALAIDPVKHATYWVQTLARPAAVTRAAAKPRPGRASRPP